MRSSVAMAKAVRVRKFNSRKAGPAAGFPACSRASLDPDLTVLMLTGVSAAVVATSGRVAVAAAAVAAAAVAAATGTAAGADHAPT
jgi:hypothetical protein